MGTCSDEPPIDFKQGQHINVFLSSKGHAGLFGGELCRRMRDRARAWPGGSGSRSGNKMGACAQPERVGMERLWIGVWYLPVSSKCFTHTPPSPIIHLL